MHKSPCEVIIKGEKTLKTGEKVLLVLQIVQNKSSRINSAKIFSYSDTVKKEKKIYF